MRKAIFWTAQMIFVAMLIWSIALFYRQVVTAGVELDVDVSWLLIAFFIKALSLWTSALKFRELMLLAGLRLRFSEWLGLSVIPTFHSYLSPAKTGHIMRAVYLRNRHALAYENYALTMLGVTLLECAIAAMLGLIAAFALADNFRSGIWIFFAIGFAIVCAGPVFLALILRCLPLPGALRGRVQLVVGATSAMLSRPRRFARLATLCAASVVGRTAGLYASFEACGVGVGTLPSMLLESARTISATVPITPSNIGISEGMIVAVSSLLSIPPSASLPGAVLSRLLTMILFIILGAWFTRVFLADLTFGRPKEQSA